MFITLNFNTAFGFWRQAMKEAKMQKSQAKRNGQNGPAALPGGPAASPATNLNMPADAQKNQAYYEALMESINTILSCPKFSDIHIAEPLAIKDGNGASSGVQATSQVLKRNSCFK